MTKGKPRRKTRILLYTGIALAALLAVAGGLLLWWNPHRGATAWQDLGPSAPLERALTPQQASEDLAFVVGRVKEHHVSAEKGLPAAVEAQYREELDGLSQTPTVLDVWRAGSRILKPLGDGHSGLNYMGGGDATRVEQAFVMTEGGLLASGGQHNGKPVAGLAGMPVDDLYERFLAQYGYENLSRARYAFPNYVRTPQGLRWLGAEPADALQVSWRTLIPESAELPYAPVPGRSAQQPFVRYDIDEEHGLGVLTLDACDNNDVYRETLKNFFADVKKAGLGAIALDLRSNGGGNSTVIGEFLRYLDACTYVDYGAAIRLGPLVLRFAPQQTNVKPAEGLVFDGDVYVLTGGRTFSSATQFAVVLRDNGLCRVIGQAPGNSPSMYGDTLHYQLPHSALALTVTYKQFTRPDAARTAEDALQPDIPTVVTADGDGVMEALYAQTQR